MSKILFINSSPNKNGNTYRIGEDLLKNTEHQVLQMSDYKIYQYGQVFEDDQIKDIFDEIKKYDTLIIGTPVYWYTIGGMLKTLIDRLYLLKEAENLKGKKLYFFAQGESPDEKTKQTITHWMNRVAILMNMELKSIVIDNSIGNQIVNEIFIDE